MPSSDDKQKRKPEKQSQNQSDWHDHVMAGIKPEDERRLLRKTRMRVKSKHGLSDSALDALYGIRSRPR